MAHDPEPPDGFLLRIWVTRYLGTWPVLVDRLNSTIMMCLELLALWVGMIRSRGKPGFFPLKWDCWSCRGHVKEPMKADRSVRNMLFASAGSCARSCRSFK